jgi:hypothetical protein
MGWIRWGLRAARRVSRSSRRSQFSYTNLGYDIIANYLNKSGQKQQSARPPEQPPVKRSLTAPATFELQPTWDWNESDLDYYRYATEKWKCFVFDKWGVLELPAGKDAAYNFFGITRLHQEDDRGSLAHGGAPGGEIDSNLPLLLLFRIEDGYDDSFAAVQSWALIQKLIEQDRPLREAGKFPRAQLRP